MAETTGHEMDWDSPIENDGAEFVFNPLDGEYTFTVTGFERGYHEAKPGGKLPSCKKAELVLTVNTNGTEVTVKDNLFLHSSCEGRICAFFAAIGQRKHGEKIVPKWSEVLGAKGRAKFYVDEYTGSDGKTYKNNRVKRYYDKDARDVPDGADWIKQAEAAGSVRPMDAPAWLQGKF